MKTSQRGIDLIKGFEGCRLVAYKPVPTEKYWTIGYGHYGPDVVPGMKITPGQAEIYLKADLAKFEKVVDDLGLNLNQNQHDALTSFAYNCGAGNLKKLCEDRTLPQIADKMLAYNKAGGKVLAGLTRRREAERTLFLMGTVSKGKVPGVNPNPYIEPTKNVRLNSRGNDVRWLQVELNRKGYKLTVNGIADNLTIGALLDFQKKAFPNNKDEWDGICGEKTRKALR